jgi:hypothetical protein
MLLVVAILAVVFMVTGCGDNIYLQNPQNQQPTVDATYAGQLEILDANTQKITLYGDDDGSLQGIEAGNLRIYPQDVKSIFFSSYRLGDLSSTLAADNSVTIAGMANNDNGPWLVELKNGKKYYILVDKLRVITYQPMYYSADTYFEYGNQFQEAMNLGLDASKTTVTITGSFGCDKMFGLDEEVKYEAGMSVAFVEYIDGVAGITHSAALTKDSDGIIRFNIGGIPLFTDGKLYVVRADGTSVQFVFSYREGGEYAWWIQGSSTVNGDVWQNYDDNADMISIQYIP